MNDSNDTGNSASCGDDQDNVKPFFEIGHLILNFTYTREPTYFKTLEASDYVKILAYSIMIVGGLFGNISVVLTVALNRSMRTTINYYVANLAVADSMICIFCMGPTLMGSLTAPNYPLGAFMCKFNTFMQTLQQRRSQLQRSSRQLVERLHQLGEPGLVAAFTFLIDLPTSVAFQIADMHFSPEGGMVWGVFDSGVTGIGALSHRLSGSRD